MYIVRYIYDIPDFNSTTEMITRSQSVAHSMEQNLSKELNGSLVKRFPLLWNLLPCS
jgi:hypothetical protein